MDRAHDKNEPKILPAQVLLYFILCYYYNILEKEEKSPLLGDQGFIEKTLGSLHSRP